MTLSDVPPVVRRDAPRATAAASMEDLTDARMICTQSYVPNVARTPQCPFSQEATAQCTVATASDNRLGPLAHPDTRTLHTEGIAAVLIPFVVFLDQPLGHREPILTPRNST